MRRGQLADRSISRRDKVRETMLAKRIPLSVAATECGVPTGQAWQWLHDDPEIARVAREVRGPWKWTSAEDAVLLDYDRRHGKHSHVGELQTIAGWFGRTYFATYRRLERLRKCSDAEPRVKG